MKTGTVRSKLGRWDLFVCHAWAWLPANLVFFALIAGTATVSYWAGGGWYYGILGLTVFLTLLSGALPLPLLFFDAWESEIRMDLEAITFGLWPKAFSDDQKETTEQPLESLSEVKRLGRCIGLLFRNGSFIPVEARLLSSDVLEALIERARLNDTGLGFIELAKLDLELFRERFWNRDQEKSAEDPRQSFD